MFVFISVWCHYVWRPRALVVRRLSKSTDLIWCLTNSVIPCLQNNGPEWQQKPGRHGFDKVSRLLKHGQQQAMTAKHGDAALHGHQLWLINLSVKKIFNVHSERREGRGFKVENRKCSTASEVEMRNIAVKELHEQWRHQNFGWAPGARPWTVIFKLVGRPMYGVLALGGGGSRCPFSMEDKIIGLLC